MEDFLFLFPWIFLQYWSLKFVVLCFGGLQPIILNWLRIRWYRRNLLEMYFQFMFVFIFFPGWDALFHSHFKWNKQIMIILLLSSLDSRILSSILKVQFTYVIDHRLLCSVLLWAPFLNFRKFPRDPSMKYPWSTPQDPAKIKNDYLKYPYAEPEDYAWDKGNRALSASYQKPRNWNSWNLAVIVRKNMGNLL